MAAKWNMLPGTFAMIIACVLPASAADGPRTAGREDRGVAEQFGEAAENVRKKIEQAVTGLAKQFEEQRVGKRLGETIKNTATKTGEELDRLGKKIEEKFSK